MGQFADRTALPQTRPGTAATIFALTSGAGAAALAVMRLSGFGANAILAAVAGRMAPPRRARLRALPPQTVTAVLSALP